MGDDPSPGAGADGDPCPLLIVGAGGFGRETAAAVHAVNSAQPRWTVLGFLDDDLALRDRQLEGVRVLGPLAEGLTVHPAASLVVCTGRPDNYFSRPLIVRRLARMTRRFATVVHPAASLGVSVSIGRGSVVLAGAVATASCRIGDHVAVMPHATITHDDDIGDFATLAAGVRLGGGVQVGRGAYLGAGAVVREGLTIGAWSLVGMGAVVTRPVPPGEVWYGVPARRRATVAIPPGLE